MTTKSRIPSVIASLQKLQKTSNYQSKLREGVDHINKAYSALGDAANAFDAAYETANVDGVDALLSVLEGLIRKAENLQHEIADGLLTDGNEMLDSYDDRRQALRNHSR